MFHLAQISPSPLPPPAAWNECEALRCGTISLMVHVPPPLVQLPANHIHAHRKINEHSIIIICEWRFILRSRVEVTYDFMSCRILYAHYQLSSVIRYGFVVGQSGRLLVFEHKYIEQFDKYI